MHSRAAPFVEFAHKLFRFGAVGIFCTALYGVLLLGLGWVFATPVLANHLIAFLLALPVSYLLQKELTFRGGGSHRHQFLRFAFVNASTLALTTMGVMIARSYDLNQFTIFGIVAIIIPGINFVAMLLWVFIEPAA